MSEPALELRELRKRYGKREALRGLSFSVPRGSITGLIGPNGAGKTTTFSIVGGLLQADSGTVNLLGQGAYTPAQHRGRLGLLPQDAELPPHTPVGPWLYYLARLQGLSRAEARKERDRVLDLVSLTDRRGAKLRELSHGMRRRVAVAQALLGDPQLVLLDEPTSGLDPHLVAQMRDVLAAQRDERGTTLVVSSHVLAELEAVADHVVFMELGQCVKEGSLAAVTGRGSWVRYLLDSTPARELLTRRLGDLNWELQGKELRVELPSGGELVDTNARVLAHLLELEAGVLEVRRGDSLEQAYLDQRDLLLATPG